MKTIDQLDGFPSDDEADAITVGRPRRVAGPEPPIPRSGSTSPSADGRSGPLAGSPSSRERSRARHIDIWSGLFLWDFDLPGDLEDRTVRSTRPGARSSNSCGPRLDG
jgi:hypothetical protein